MDYIIDGALINSYDQLSNKSILIQNNKIAYMGEELKKYKQIRMDVSSYILSPGYVMVNEQILFEPSFADFKENIKGYINNGCSTVLVPCQVPYKKDINSNVKKARHLMNNSSIDYAIGLQIPFSVLDPIVIRSCKKSRVPFIIVEIEEDTSLHQIPWGWIKESLFLYNVPIYPKWKIENPKLLKTKALKWEEITNDMNIQTDVEFPEEKKLVNKKIIKQIGVYPLRGDLLVGGEVDYILFQSEEDREHSKALINVKRNRVLKAGNQVFYYPGYGKELEIKVPGHFVTI